MTKELILASNRRLHVAISAYRIYKSVEMRSEIYNALLQRDRMRHTRLTEEEKQELHRKWLADVKPYTGI